MTWVLLTLLGGVLQLLVAEVFGWCPWLAARMVRTAARALPPAEHMRYEQEWLAELDAVPGLGLAKLIFALAILAKSRATAKALTPAPAAAVLPASVSRHSYKHTNSKGVTYYLNAKKMTLRGGKVQSIYFFSKDERADTGCDLPFDRFVNEESRTGFLTLKPKGVDPTPSTWHRRFIFRLPRGR